jgi:RHS repeat-associated protein
MTGLLGYQSAWTDAAAGKDLMGARWYDPGAGDFTSADTVAVSPDPDEAAGNPFAYAADEPLDLVDPTGHYIVPEGGAEGAGTSERIGNGATSASNYIADQTTARIVQQAVITAPNDAAKAAAARAAVAKVDAEQATAKKAAVAAAAAKAAKAAARRAAEEQAQKQAAAKEAAAKAKLKPTDGHSVPGPSGSVISAAVGGSGIGAVGVSSTAADAGDGAILFRGAAEGYAGNPGTQRSGVTPASTDPKVATAFATRAEQYGRALVHIATQEDLAGIKVELNAGYIAYEAEAYAYTTVSDFAARAGTSVPASVAREVLGDMGIDIPSQIFENGDLTSYLRSSPLMTADQVAGFLRRIWG